MVRGSQEWKALWWGNRTYTIAALESASTLAFTRMVGGKEEYGQLAKQILMDCAEWDPKGATGFHYNDEAGMPYAYHFARTYTFLHDLLDARSARNVPPRHEGPRRRHVRPSLSPTSVAAVCQPQQPVVAFPG